MMMRLRQLCCHRELIKEVNWAEVMKQYIHKAMTEHTGDNEDIPTQPVGA